MSRSNQKPLRWPALCTLATLLTAASLAHPALAADPAPEAPASDPEAATPAPEDEAIAPPTAVLTPTRLHTRGHRRPWSHELVAGLLTGALVVPSSALIAGAMGRGPGNLLAAALPATLFYLALPPLAVTFAAYAVGRYFHDDQIGWSPTLWLALGVQVLGFALTALTGFSTLRANDLVAITAVHTLALGAVVTLTLPWGHRAPKPTSERLTHQAVLP